MTIRETKEGERLAHPRDKPGIGSSGGRTWRSAPGGTVREDYSATGEAWAHFPHEHARSRAYRWNEDGMAAICDRHQVLCFGIGPLERPRSDPQGTDVWFDVDRGEPRRGREGVLLLHRQHSDPLVHADSLQVSAGEYPYARLVEENAKRGKGDREFELVDTGIFDGNRYFDVEVEYAKAAEEDMLVRIRATNRGPEAAPIHVLPTIWFRNTWGWGHDGRRPSITAAPRERREGREVAPRQALVSGEYALHCAGADELLFTENDTNTKKLFGADMASPMSRMRSTLMW